ncbi:TIR domain-containing protein [Labedaea rhizosphaerae]|uniref:TIR domain-containing protein n=1 Tax=Labedaea rhizosphaerae TaxID=598644 RepID=A0A4R6RTI4_LABRH|nr:TIR domain-containing protein [Labedaea rhizosphaerae]TDP89637.1 TIR domain-containing protein [Labedaea rhizosphaerae]
MLFINFRVGDGADKAAWLDSELSTVFGRDQVFRSSRSLPLGQDYDPGLWAAVENCSAMIVVVGERWLTDFRARLFEPDDIVRKEIATALKAGKPVIPVLEQAGRMRADQLPPDLAPLAKCQYIRLTYRDGHSIPGFIDRLIQDAPELGIGVMDGIQDLAAWDRERTSPLSTTLPDDLVLLGREGAVEQVLSWFSGPPRNLIIQGQTPDEVAAFVAAVLNSVDRWHRAVLITAKPGWDHAARIPMTFPAVVMSDDVPVGPTQSTRHVIIARDWSVSRAGELVLPRVPRDKARVAFAALGVPPHQADQYAGLARRSRQALIRRLSPNEPRPPWTQAPGSTIAVPLVLVSRWSTTNTADHDVIARITGHDYPEVDRFAQSSSISADPFLHRSGTRWQHADPYDAWSQLMSQVSATDIDRFSDAAVEVLTEIDPVLSLPDPEQPSAGLMGIGRTWSDDLRQGLAHGLARLGDAGTATVAGNTAENHAAIVVHRVLESANDDRTGLLWRSLADVLPLLAEAAPRVFLDAVQKGLRGDEPMLGAMFEDTDARLMHRHSAHTDLLWALETLAWAPTHCTATALQLARLAEHDPGGRLSNRPSESLVSLLGHRPSPIPLDRRITIINQVRRRYPAVGWQLLTDLTDSNKLLMHPARPRVREDWTGADAAMPDPLQAYEDGITAAMVSDLTARPERWVDCLPLLGSLPADWREALLTALEAIDVTRLDPVRIRALWDKGTEVLRWEQGEPAGPRFHTPEEIARLTAFLERIEPIDDPARHAWLFTWHPRLPGVDSTDLAARDAAVAKRRREVLTEVLDRHGIGGVICLAEASELGDRVGWTLAQVADDSVRDEVLARLGEPLAAGWIHCRTTERGRDWAAETADALPPDPVGRTAFLMALPVDWAFELLGSETQEVCDRFYDLTPAFPFPADGAEDYLAGLLARGRAEAVIDALSLAVHPHADAWRPSAELITAAFHHLLNTTALKSDHTEYAVGSLLTYLHSTGHDPRDVARFEVAFASLLHDRQPVALLAMISADPGFFVELHQVRYLPTEKLNPKALGFYMTGLQLRCVPGQDGNTVDKTYLLDWVHKARRRLKDIEMENTGDREIGALISAGPDGVDGAWPSEAVREVLELEDADRLHEGFRLGLANNRNFTSRGVFDGGEQERELAAPYDAWADTVEPEWPQTAQVLRDHAESLRGQARHWDREAEDDHDE